MSALRRYLLPLLWLLPFASATALPPCTPCVGVDVDDPSLLLALLEDRVEDPLFVRWSLDTLPPSPPPVLQQLRARGLRPWLVVRLQTPPPLLANAAWLDDELELLAQVAAEAGEEAVFELFWQPPDTSGTGRDPVSRDPTEYAFLLKRAAVAITGAQPTAEVYATGVAGPELLTRLYEQEVAAYLDGVVAPSGDAVERLTPALRELDPAARVALVAAAPPGDPLLVLPLVAAAADHGAAIVFVALPTVESTVLDPLRLLSHELSGDISLDAGGGISGARAWSFVRGEDLGLRVIVERPAEEGDSMTVRFPDPGLSSPKLLDPTTGEAIPLFGGRRQADGYQLEISEPPSAMLIAFERLSAAQLAGMEEVEEKVTVEDERGIPVEEILRRLQAFEDAQSRRLETYRAINTSHLRFLFGNTGQSIETTFEGDFFFRQGEGFDWAWQKFLINGVLWRRKTIPKIPLIQPEKAAALPGDITFTRDYSYRLRGTATVSDRDCWVVDFRPNVAVQPGRTLYQGTVWIDRELYARVRTRAVQLGLEGDVISNEETIHYSPFDPQGSPAPWEASSFWLPSRIVGQQLWKLLETTIVLERETRLSDIGINPPDFDEARQEVLLSETTMVRDTEEGLRYLQLDEETGERIVQEPDPDRFFIIGGVFWDESFDFPIPLAGVNWLSLDWRGTGTQTNLFFAGALLTADIANPSLFGSKFDGGADVTAIAFAGTDTIFRDGVETPTEDVKLLNPNADFRIGRPLGSFFKLDLEYSVGYATFSRADETDPLFVLPQDHLNHTFTLTGRFSRRGYRFRADVGATIRDSWEEWGLPGSDDYDPEHKEFSRWGASLAKTWYLENFRQFGLGLEYVGGEDLDRFSKYGFGFFSDVRVHGYQGDKVRAEEAWAAHVTYGFGFGETFRLDFLGDVAWATDEPAGFERELLAGVGAAGTFFGPWGTLVNLDLGVAVAGPDDGFSLFLAFLKLFPKK